MFGKKLKSNKLYKNILSVGDFIRANEYYPDENTLDDIGKCALRFYKKFGRGYYFETGGDDGDVKMYYPKPPLKFGQWVTGRKKGWLERDFWMDEELRGPVLTWLKVEKTNAKKALLKALDGFITFLESKSSKTPKSAKEKGFKF